MHNAGRDNPPSEAEIYDYGLFLIQEVLDGHGKQLSDYHLPMPEHDWNARIGNRLIAEQLAYIPQEEAASAAQQIPLLNVEQKAAYNTIMDAVSTNQSKTFFLHGPAGTGKTFVYNTLCHSLRSQSKIVLCVASSGIASLLLQGGRTVHFRFKVPIQIHETSMCSIKKGTSLAELLKRADLIVWDEAPMQHRHIAEAINCTLKDIREDQHQFGGLTVVFGGDFKQILPVIVKGSRAEIVGASLTRSRLWQNMHVLFLKKNMRLGQSDADRAFAKWLQEMGTLHQMEPSNDPSTGSPCYKQYSEGHRCNRRGL